MDMISEYYTDEELISQLKSFFDDEEQEKIDFNSALSQIKEVNEDTNEVIIRNRIFHFDKVLCEVKEVTT